MTQKEFMKFVVDQCDHPMVVEANFQEYDTHSWIGKILLKMFLAAIRFCCAPKYLQQEKAREQAFRNIQWMLRNYQRNPVDEEFNEPILRMTVEQYEIHKTTCQKAMDEGVRLILTRSGRDVIEFFKPKLSEDQKAAIDVEIGQLINSW